MNIITMISTINNIYNNNDNTSCSFIKITRNDRQNINSTHLIIITIIIIIIIIITIKCNISINSYKQAYFPVRSPYFYLELELDNNLLNYYIII